LLLIVAKPLPNCGCCDFSKDVWFQLNFISVLCAYIQFLNNVWVRLRSRISVKLLGPTGSAGANFRPRFATNGRDPTNYAGYHAPNGYTNGV